MNIDKNEIINKYWPLWDMNGLICEPNGNLYHYTTADAINSIFANNEFWLTNLNFMNDKSEIEYACDLFYKRLKLSTISEKMQSELTDTFLKALHDGIFENTFALSLSTNSDSLPMWNYYANTVGYILGIDNEFVRELGNHEMIYQIVISNGEDGKGKSERKPYKMCSEVISSSSKHSYGVKANNIIYDQQVQIEIIDEILKDISNQISIDSQESRLYINFALSKLVDFIPFFKHPCYSNEEEYRVLLTFKDSEMHKIQQYRVREGALVPYIKLKMNRKTYLNKIGISPFHVNEYTKLGIENLIKNFPQKIEYIESKLPVRF